MVSSPRPSSASLRFLWELPKTAAIGLSGVMATMLGYRPLTRR